MPNKHHNNSLTAILLAMLMLASTACSTTDQTTITGPAAETPTPNDTTPAPDDGTPAPDATPGETGGTAVTSDAGTTGPVAPVVEPSTSVTPGDQGSDDTETVIFEYPDTLLANQGDTSTPLGKLCWAFQEFIITESTRFYQILIDGIPDLEMALPDMESESENVGPVGVVNEESEDQILEFSEYFSDTLGSIQAPGIMGVVNDAGFSEEVQLFAQAFFSYVEAYTNQFKTVGYASIDNDSLPYQDIEDLPYIEEFYKAVGENPDKCGSQSEEEAEKEVEESIARFSQALTELFGE